MPSDEFEKVMDEVSAELLGAIKESGEVPKSDYLDVGWILNKKPKPNLILQIGEAMAHFFYGSEIDSFVTVDASGNPLAIMAALQYYNLFGVELPVLYIKKGGRITDHDAYIAIIKSATSGSQVTLSASKKYIENGEKYGFVDDFRFMGRTLTGAEDILKQGCASIDRVFSVIHKTFSSPYLPPGYNEGDMIYLIGIKDPFSNREELIKQLTPWGYLK